MHSEVYRINIKNLERVFHTKQGDIPAIKDIDLKIKDGEFFSIVGPSGCGKTTLLRILAGLETASAGSIRINATKNDRPLCSMVFQEQSIFPWMSKIEK